MISASSKAHSLHRYALMAALALLSACSVLPKPETLAVYQLAVPAMKGPPQAARLPWSLRVATPYSSQAIDSMRVLVLPQANQVSAYGGARWSDPGPVLLRDYLAGAFRAEGRLASVNTDAGDAQADFELGGDLIAFQAEYHDGVPTVHIRYDAALMQVPRNRIVATRSFDVLQPVQGKEVPQVIAAFGAAADSLSAEMRPWVLQHGARPAKAKTRR